MAASAFALVGTAQRSIDLSIESIDKPTQLVSNTGFDLQFTVKNNGTDTVKTSDSIWYRMIIANQIFVPGNGFLFTMAKAMNPGDTQMISIKIPNFGLSITGSALANFCIYGFCINRSDDSVKVELGNGTQNNILCKQIQFGWYAGLAGAEDLGSISMFPNPANDIVNLTYSLSKNQPVSVRLMDATGRQVSQMNNENQQAGMHTEELNTANLANGIYHYQVTIGNQTSTGKIVVAH